MTLPATELVMHDEAVAHALRYVRALLAPHVRTLIVCGPPGSGRRSLVHLAAFAVRVAVHRPALSRSFSLDSFRADLESLMIAAAAAEDRAGRARSLAGGATLAFLVALHPPPSPGCGTAARRPARTAGLSARGGQVSREELVTESHLLLLCEMLHGNLAWDAGEGHAGSGQSAGAADELGLFLDRSQRRAIAEKVGAGVQETSDESGGTVGEPSARELSTWLSPLPSRCRLLRTKLHAGSVRRGVTAGGRCSWLARGATYAWSSASRQRHSPPRRIRRPRSCTGHTSISSQSGPTTPSGACARPRVHSSVRLPDCCAADLAAAPAGSWHGSGSRGSPWRPTRATPSGSATRSSTCACAFSAKGSGSLRHRRSYRAPCKQRLRQCTSSPSCRLCRPSSCGGRPRCRVACGSWLRRCLSSRPSS